MKKTLIALVVVASAASGAANAWSTGDFTGSFDINGEITSSQYNDKWEWKSGEALSFQNTNQDMSDGNKVLTITQTTPAPILLGRTKEAFSAPAVGVGAIPLISFSDYEGNTVQLQSSGGQNKGFLNLPMKDAEGRKLGDVKINVTTAGVLSRNDSDFVKIISVVSGDDSAIYNGGLVSSVVASGQSASALVRKFGNDGHSELLQKVVAAAPEAAKKSQQSWAVATKVNMVNSNVMASSYSLGIDQGQTIEATFTNPVTTTTQWSAPLNVAVTYN
ncbi:fimbrial protein [Escherichia coli O51]|uniref:F4 family fimbrial subunit n=1 Tax=Escherichia coli TaxID=562 RepID=UPI000BE4E6FD|nr:fimbrial protein [Escherichia coli]EFN8623808.1 fimbrial protein [Escherichia coli O51]EIQ0266861.1 fimbrial protein [Escherichia coli]